MISRRITQHSRALLLVVLFLLILLSSSTLARSQKLVQSTNPQMRLKWYEEHLAMKEQSPFKGLKWRFIGPEIMSGRVTDVDVPEGSRYTIYAASASGGVWKTTNEGTTWEPIFEEAPSTSIGDIATAPSEPNIIWVGTGEANIFRSSMAGCGVYKSEDAGKTWQHMGLAGTHTIARIIIHPKNPDIVYVAASGHEWTHNEERGVFKTTDGGKTWEKVLYIDEKTGAIDLVMDPTDPDVLYASMWNRIRRRWSDPRPGPGDGIFKTTDGGKTWKRLTRGLPPSEVTGRIGIDIARTNPRVIYAFIDNHEIIRRPKKGERDSYGRPMGPVIKGAEVYRSDDGGGNWVKVSPSNKMMSRFCSTYGWVFGQIRVDPSDENTIYIMGLSIGKSTDGGKTFKIIRYPGLHGDHHAMWIDPEDSNHIINGNDGGVNVSYDGGKTWINYENLPVVQFYNVTVDMAKPFNIYGSIQDNGSWKGPVTYRPGRDPKWLWTRIPGGEASYLVLDPTNPNILYSQSFYGRIQRSEFKDGKWKTVRITPKAGEGEPPLRGQWLAPFIMSPHNPLIIYHGMQYLFRSLNRGDTWERISPDLTYNNPEEMGELPYAIPFQTITSISESPLKFGLIYAGTDDGRVWVTRDGGANWKEIIQDLPYKKHVSRIVASAYEEGTVYLALNGKRDDDFAAYLFKSEDCGTTWVDIANNIPCGPINVIREDPKNKKVLYVGTDLG
ncbi:MAG: WD40/YVTN/BNR-like repeat-containing protein, partial [Candidatus Aminicenantales bacterium]